MPSQGVSPGTVPQGAGSWGAPREHSGSRAWREPTKQSRVLISHRSHATTFCSGCCPTFQSHTFASDFNGLHHSPKLYLTKRGGSRQAAARNQSNLAPRVCPGTVVSSRSLPAAGSSGQGPRGILGDADAPIHPQLCRSQPRWEGAAGVGDSTQLSGSSSTSRSLSTPSLLYMHNSIFRTKGFNCCRKGKIKLHLNGDLHNYVCVWKRCTPTHHPPPDVRLQTTRTHPRQLEDEY